MDAKEKQVCRYRLGLTILKIIELNKAKSDDKLPNSLRQLAASSSTEYSIIQKITSGKKDPQFTTLVAIIDGFKMSFGEFVNVYESLSDVKASEYQSMMEKKQAARKKKKVDSGQIVLLNKRSNKKN